MTVFRAFSDQEIIEHLKNNVSDGKVVTDLDSLKEHSFSKYASNGNNSLALAYIEVKSVDDVKGVFQTARKYHIAVIPQDQATSTVIGSEAIEHSFVLSTAKMNHIIEISKADSLAVVEPGVVNGDLDNAAHEQGMFYAPDPASKPISGIGGNVSTNAGGLSTVKYGATKDNILGLTVVLTDGRVLKLGGRTLKQAFGYDLTQLFVGSEGTLGIVTQVIVKLLPIPLGTSAMGMATFSNMTELAKAVADIRISGVYPTMLEALDSNTLQALDKYKQTHYSTNGAMLIFKLDNATDEALTVIQKLLNDHSAEDVQITKDQKEQDKLLQLRRDMLPAVFSGNNHIMEDMAVPLSKLAPLMDYIQETGDKYHIKIYSAGHAGDGNVHPTLTWSESEKEAPEAVILALQDIFNKTLAFGGTISGEHAVGMTKNQWNNAELGDDVDYVQHQIKTLFDPMNLLNPKRKID